MRKILSRSFIIYTLAACLLLLTKRVSAQDGDSLALANADTSHFFVNHADGWQLFNSYGAYTTDDTVQFEIIVRHANNINWAEEQYLGRIRDTVLVPSSPQLIECRLMQLMYVLRIDEYGRCYLRLLEGHQPPVVLVTIPLHGRYRRSFNQN